MIPLRYELLQIEKEKYIFHPKKIFCKGPFDSMFLSLQAHKVIFDSSFLSF